MIIIENVTKKRKNLVLEIDHLEISQGLVTMIVGKKSSGKSTILKLISGAIEFDAGVIKIDDMSIDKYKKYHGIFYAPDKAVGKQNMTVFKNIDLFEDMIPSFDSRKLERALKLADIPPHLKLEALSKEQQKRYMLELFKLTNDAMLLIDGSMSCMDEENKLNAKQLIQTHLINESNYVVMASNNAEDIEMFGDHLIYLKNNEVFFEGTALEMQERYQMWQGKEEELPKLGVVGIRRNKETLEALIDTYVFDLAPVERLELNDLLNMLERGSR
ncbi:ATP-binding cassette domain-containing protein [Erysipelothrix inopinata]|uniref:ATP-binding cassette domain-containing protein n=1 Tax=Erysipelothrix inopinata TaxID=225084 RepID=A0A7G9S069_9FIRM|nr:ATP-binding cassette domain-containing protein [Erysipelothrix inopinata]QNN61244.1 ATP-binding cassette domain-containing protein [Erysipelothrix inopinata]